MDQGSLLDINFLDVFLCGQDTHRANQKKEKIRKTRKTRSGKTVPSMYIRETDFETTLDGEFWLVLLFAPFLMNMFPFRPKHARSFEIYRRPVAVASRRGLGTH